MGHNTLKKIPPTSQQITTFITDMSRKRATEEELEKLRKRHMGKPPTLLPTPNCNRIYLLSTPTTPNIHGIIAPHSHRKTGGLLEGIIHTEHNTPPHNTPQQEDKQSGNITHQFEQLSIHHTDNHSIDQALEPHTDTSHTEPNIQIIEKHPPTYKHPTHNTSTSTDENDNETKLTQPYKYTRIAQIHRQRARSNPPMRTHKYSKSLGEKHI